MKIILVRPNISNRFMIVPPLGLGYLAAAAKKAGHEVVIWDAWLQNQSPVHAVVDVALRNPDIIGIQVFYDTIKWTRKFIDIIKPYKPENVKIIVGGPEITAHPELAKELGADEGVVGEGEYYILFGLRSRHPVFDVNKIPAPDWDSINLPAYWPYMNNVTMPTRGKRPATIQRSRGCPYHCTFCAGHITHGYKVRIRDDDNVIAEIKYLQDRWNVDEIWFQDDDILADYDRARKLFWRLEPLKLHIRLPNGIRIENMTIWMANDMRRAGVYFTGIGIESGNTRVLKRIKKVLDINEVKSDIAMLHRHNITTSGFFILGLPTETRTEMQDTVRFALNTKLNHAQFGIFIPYSGSEDEHERSLLSDKELIKIQRNATLRFYMRPRIIWGLIKNFQWSQIKALLSHPWFKKWRGK